MTREQFVREVRYRYAVFLITALKERGLLREAEYRDAMKRIARKFSVAARCSDL